MEPSGKLSCPSKQHHSFGKSWFLVLLWPQALKSIHMVLPQSHTGPSTPAYWTDAVNKQQILGTRAYHVCSSFFSGWRTNSCYSTFRIAERTLHLEVRPPVQGPRFEQLFGKNRGTTTSSLDKYIVKPKTNEETKQQQQKLIKVKITKLPKFVQTMQVITYTEQICKFGLPALKHGFFKHFLKCLSSIIINTIANLMFLKNNIRNAFRECKRYFVYVEITSERLIG